MAKEFDDKKPVRNRSHMVMMENRIRHRDYLRSLRDAASFIQSWTLLNRIA